MTGAYTHDAERNELIFQGKDGVEFKVGEQFGPDMACRYIQIPNFNRPEGFNGQQQSACAQSSMQVVTARLTYHF